MSIGDLWKTLFVLVLFVVAAWSATLWPNIVVVDIPSPLVDGVIAEGEYTDAVILNEFEVYVFNDEEFVYIGLKSPGRGWVAIGFSPVEVHGGANFLFGTVVDGVVLVSDEYGFGRFEHDLDTSLGGTNNIVEYAGVEAVGTVIEFKIPLDSGDVYDTVLEKGKSYSIIVAYHESMDDFQLKHTERFRKSITIK